MKHGLVFVALASALLVGCASTSLENQSQFVGDYAKTHFGQSANWQIDPSASAASRQRTFELLAAPLSAETAVAVALTNSAAFQAVLGTAAAQAAGAIQMGRPANPVFGFERLVRREDGGVDLDIGRMLSISLLDFIYLPARQQISLAMQHQARLAGAAAVVETAIAARQAWVRAVAAEQSARYYAQVLEAAEASAELARRMFTVGNFSRLQRARQQAFYADAHTQLTRARQTALAEREALVRVLGLDTEMANKLRLPERLPDLPESVTAKADALQAALDQRLDVRLAKAELDMLAAKWKIQKSASVLHTLHVAGVRNSETGKPPQKGYELEIAVPIFDWGDASRSRAQAEYTAAVNRLLQVGVDAASQLREKHAAALAAHHLALHYRNEIVPLRKVIADEMLLKYNGMLVGVFDLLAETRAQIGSVILAIEAEREYWLADAALQAASLGRPVAGSAMTVSASVESGSPAH
jgi:outer membrane protein TolC